MTKKQLSVSLTSVLGATFAVSIAGTSIANAEENPFEMSAFEGGYSVAVDTNQVVEKSKEMVEEAIKDAPGRDMEGNLVDYDYGGDSKGAYAGGKVGTGAKDPAVCGTFTGTNCGADGGSHLKK